MARVRIYQPAKTAMQSGRRNTLKWVLEFEPEGRKQTDPLMGWTGSGDTLGQIRLTFDSREAAVAFARKKGHAYQLDEPRQRRLRIKSYAENFR